MMISDLRLDTTRYKTRFADGIIESREDGNVAIHFTEKGNILVTVKEPYETKASKEECPDKDDIFDMVKFVIIKDKGVISGKTIESILREGDVEKVDALRKELTGASL